MSLATTVSGTNLSVSTSVPATNDIAGFEALTYTEGDTCEIVETGTIGYEWSTVEGNTICPDSNAAKKSSKNLIPFTATLNLVINDPLQVIFEVAFNDRDSIISLMITLPDGVSKRFVQVQVSKFPETFGTKDNYIVIPIEFLPQKEWVKKNA